MKYIALGLKRDTALDIAGVTKHQYYHKPKKGKRGAPPSTHTERQIDNTEIKVLNTEVIDKIKIIHSEPDIDYGYQKMTFALNILGYNINHKKVYRLMKENQLLRQKLKKAQRKFVKYRIVNPEGPLNLLEMDIKFVWIESARQHGYILQSSMYLPDKYLHGLLK